MTDKLVSLAQYLSLTLFVGISAWLGWLVVGQQGPESDGAQLWSSSYQVLAWFGAFYGIWMSRYWGGTASVLGRSSLAFGLGLLAQSFGQSVFSYYYYSGVEAPYPSIADIGYFGSIPLYIYAIFKLASASGAHLTYRSMKGRLLVVLVPIALLVLSYVVFLRGHDYDWSMPLVVFLDLGYPFGQSIYLAGALLAYFLTKEYLGGMMRSAVLFFIGALFVQYLADYAFLYQVSRGTYVGGLEIDYLYLISYFVMTVSLINLSTVYIKIRQT